jgi:hypothetical protein
MIVKPYKKRPWPEYGPNLHRKKSIGALQVLDATKPEHVFHPIQGKFSQVTLSSFQTKIL